MAKPTKTRKASPATRKTTATGRSASDQGTKAGVPKAGAVTKASRRAAKPAPRGTRTTAKAPARTTARMPAVTKADLEARVARLERANAKLKATAKEREATVSELEREVTRLKDELREAQRVEAAESGASTEATDSSAVVEQAVEMEAQAVDVEAALLESAYAGGGRDISTDVVAPTGEAETRAFGERGATASDEARGAAPNEQVDDANSPTAETDGPVR
jgi:plasmid stability protein